MNLNKKVYICCLAGNRHAGRLPHARSGTGARRRYWRHPQRWWKVSTIRESTAAPANWCAWSVVPRTRPVRDRRSGASRPHQANWWSAVRSAHQVDPLLVQSVIQVESNYNPYAVSHKGAEGLMQLMPSTSRMLGVTNSFDPVENIEAGRKISEVSAVGLS